ncbi:MULTISPECIES: ANTAR domain-containing protein [unclassified Streptomyces]|uniref:ANTAR domain-containing protein n=1 Tax=Streptomyces sp. NBC_00060 TaxID=2975636 RepID=A0AAU2HAT0_9ACTN
MAQPSYSAEPVNTGPEADPGLELGQLRRAMESRGTIDLARGILMAAFAISPEDAWSALVMTSQNTNTKLNRLARQVVDSAGGDPLPKGIQKQLSVAIAKLATAGGAPAAAPSQDTADVGGDGSAHR